MSRFPKITPQEAAEFISNGDMVAMSGFTAAGAPKAVPQAIVERAKTIHAKGEPFKIKLITGASLSASIDDSFAAEQITQWRAPYQSASGLRKAINAGEIDFIDMHLSEVSQMIKFGFFEKIKVAIIEATEVTEDGKVYLSTGIGNSPTFLKEAEKIIIEVNSYHSKRLREMMDIVSLEKPPHRDPITIKKPLDKIGTSYVQVDPNRIVGIVETNAKDEIGSFGASDAISQGIAHNVEKFLLSELASGRIPSEFLPVQSGVGNINNAVMETLGANQEIPKFHMFTEVLQESVVGLMEQGKIAGVSTCSFTVTPGTLQKIYDNMDFFSPKLVLRPQEISNNPELIRRLGVIALNVGLEFDIYGHANSTHVAGTSLMNGIGGSADFERNAYLSVFMAPSIAKGGKISTIVPMCSHVDHSEHSVKVIITEQGIADLRGLSPIERAKAIIDNCAHPMYRDYLHAYLARSKSGHIKHDLNTVFELHRNLLEHGQMLYQNSLDTLVEQNKSLK